MEFTFRRMWQISTILVIITMVSVTCRGVDNLREQAEGKLFLYDNNKQEHRQDKREVACRGRPYIRRPITCATVPESGRKRNTLNGNLDDEDDMDKIVGGSNAELGEVPWIANLLINGYHSCAGAILGEVWILTAASCFPLEGQNIYEVVVGDKNRFSDDLDEQTFTATAIHLHNLYDETTKANNLALVKLRSNNDNGIQFTRRVKPVCLHSTSTPQVGTNLLIAGWGYDSVDALKKISLPIEDMTICTMQFYQLSLELTGTICVGRYNGSSALCMLDRGGPATSEFSGYYVLTGMVSYHSSCIRPYRSSLLTNIANQVTWIQNTIRNNSLNDRERFLPTIG